MKMCDTLRKHLCMPTYIYLNDDDCWLTFFYTPEKTFNLFNYVVIPENVVSEKW